jgi:hypothetical protein
MNAFEAAGTRRNAIRHVEGAAFELLAVCRLIQRNGVGRLTRLEQERLRDAVDKALPYGQQSVDDLAATGAQA